MESQQVPVVPDDAVQVTASGRVRLVGCKECTYWFLGCLRGRQEWKDKADTPNARIVNGRLRCDAFEWDPDEERQGRAVAR